MGGKEKHVEWDDRVLLPGQADNTIDSDQNRHPIKFQTAALTELHRPIDRELDLNRDPSDYVKPKDCTEGQKTQELQKSSYGTSQSTLSKSPGDMRRQVSFVLHPTKNAFIGSPDSNLKLGVPNSYHALLLDYNTFLLKNSDGHGDFPSKRASMSGEHVLFRKPGQLKSKMPVFFKRALPSCSAKKEKRSLSSEPKSAPPPIRTNEDVDKSYASLRPETSKTGLRPRSPRAKSPSDSPGNRPASRRESQGDPDRVPTFPLSKVNSFQKIPGTKNISRPQNVSRPQNNQRFQNITKSQKFRRPRSASNMSRGSRVKKNRAKSKDLSLPPSKTILMPLSLAVRIEKCSSAPGVDSTCSVGTQTENTFDARGKHINNKRNSLRKVKRQPKPAKFKKRSQTSSTPFSKQKKSSSSPREKARKTDQRSLSPQRCFFCRRGRLEDPNRTAFWSAPSKMTNTVEESSSHSSNEESAIHAWEMEALAKEHQSEGAECSTMGKCRFLASLQIDDSFYPSDSLITEKSTQGHFPSWSETDSSLCSKPAISASNAKPAGNSNSSCTRSTSRARPKTPSGQKRERRKKSRKPRPLTYQHMGLPPLVRSPSSENTFQCHLLKNSPMRPKSARKKMVGKPKRRKTKRK